MSAPPRALRCEGKIADRQVEGGRSAIPFDEIIVAVGRKARLSGYGSKRLASRRQTLVVDAKRLKTLYPNIFAVAMSRALSVTHFARTRPGMRR
jgi:pyruvate/2-oxoglutarate dehydrogenase complex dihydrolipoamide dehydrogenase (E3) component